MADQFSAKRGVEETLQAPGTTTGNGTVLTLPDSFHSHTVYLKGSAGIATGAIQIEVSDDPAYTGTWAAIGSAVTAVASSIIATTFTGTYKAVRARVSTTVTGGTIGVTYVGS